MKKGSQRSDRMSTLTHFDGRKEYMCVYVLDICIKTIINSIPEVFFKISLNVHDFYLNIYNKNEFLILLSTG